MTVAFSPKFKAGHDEQRLNGSKECLVSQTRRNDRPDIHMNITLTDGILNNLRRLFLKKKLPLEYIVIALTLFAAVLFILFVDGFARLGNFEILARNSAALTVLSC